MSENETEHVTLGGLRRRGWTAAMVARFVSEGPDEIRPNPVFRTRAPMQLYTLARIQAVERSDAFLLAREQSNARRDLARARSDRRRDELLKAARSLRVRIKVMHECKLREAALQHHNMRNETRRLDRGWEPPNLAPAQVSKPFLDRIAVNYITA